MRCQVLIKPGLIQYKGTKSVVEFLVNNYTIVDAGGNRDTKKVAKFLLLRNIERENMNLLGGDPLCEAAKLLHHLLLHPHLHAGDPCLLHLHDPH